MISRKYQNNQLSRYYVDKIAISNSNVKAPLVDFLKRISAVVEKGYFLLQQNQPFAISSLLHTKTAIKKTSEQFSECKYSVQKLR